MFSTFMYFIIRNNAFIINNVKILNKMKLKSTIIPQDIQQNNEDINKMKIENEKKLKKFYRNKINGCDERFFIGNISITENEGELFMTKFRETYFKFNLLNELENPNTSNLYKLNLLTKPSISPANLNLKNIDW